MFNKLADMSKSLAHFSQMMQPIATICQMYEANFLKQGSSKNAFLDTVIEIINSHKTEDVVQEDEKPAE
jgi:hypothetical protein